MQLKMIKILIARLFSLINVGSLLERLKKNYEYVVKDDEVILDVMLGFDEKQPVIIVKTNKHVYVLADDVIHLIRKSAVISIDSQKGLLSTLVEFETIDEPIYFKIFSKRALKSLKEW